MPLVTSRKDWGNETISWLFNEKDKEDFGIVFDDEHLKLTFRTKQSFKTFLKRKGKQFTENYLYQLKISHSKLDDLKFSELKCAQYLVDPRMTQKEAKLLFKLRTRMYQVKTNFRGLYNYNLSCDLCKSSTCDQWHLLVCKVLQSLVPELQNTKVKYHHLFGSIDDMIPAIKLFMKITEQRDEIIQVLSVNNK